jgi:hypothetical protein
MKTRRRVPRERTATPEELEEDRRRCIESRAGKGATAGAEGTTAATTGATGTEDVDRANIRALRQDLKRTANMVAMPSMTDLVFGGATP